MQIADWRLRIAGLRYVVVVGGKKRSKATRDGGVDFEILLSVQASHGGATKVHGIGVRDSLIGIECIQRTCDFYLIY